MNDFGGIISSFAIILLFLFWKSHICYCLVDSVYCLCWFVIVVNVNPQYGTNGCFSIFALDSHFYWWTIIISTIIKVKLPVGNWVSSTSISVVIFFNFAPIFRWLVYFLNLYSLDSPKNIINNFHKSIFAYFFVSPWSAVIQLNIGLCWLNSQNWTLNIEYVHFSELIFFALPIL